MAATAKSPFTLYRQGLTLEQACRRAHGFASRHPGLYRLRVRALCVSLLFLPFLTLVFMAGVTLGFPWAFRESEFLRPIYSVPLLRWGMFGFVYATWIPLVAAYAAGVFRGLTLRLPQPAGVRLTATEAPRMFRMLLELSRTLDVPPVDELIISPERVLEIRRLPRGAGLPLCGIGASNLVLIAGLPVLEELSPQHLRALLAHEMAHLATHNRRFGGHVLAFRTRLEVLRQAAEASALDRGFWSRLPDEALADITRGLLQRLVAATFPAVRQHESEADAIAAAIAGREFAAAALLRLRMAGHALNQQFRDDCLRLAETTPEPPPDLFDRRATTAAGPISESQVYSWLRGALEQKDNLAESHPPLWDRFRTLGYQLSGMRDFHELLEQVQPHGALGETAARFFLGDTCEALRAGFFREWAKRQARDWRARFEAHEKLRGVAAEWDATGAASLGDPDALWQVALAIGNTRSWREALPVARRILEIQPDHGDANLLTGQLMIEDGNAAGLDALERAMAASPGFIPLACALAAGFAESGGDKDAAARYRKRAEEHNKGEEAMARERGHVSPGDSFSPADCPQETEQALRRIVEGQASHIRAAYLLRKKVKGDERRPLYVLGIERRAFLYENPALANRLLLERITRAHGFPAGVLICVVTRANRALLEKWKAVPDSLLRARPSQEPAEPVLFPGHAAQFTRPVTALLDPAGRPSLPAPASPQTPSR
jgi:Zn-dependent protease with chaperone function